MAADAVTEEFVTIVPVGENRIISNLDPGFVTVLTVGEEPGAAEVLVQRPRGARLGLGLKFEGGSAAAERVRRLLVQSCAEDSPAANASTPWGKLIPGDEILAIDNIPVSELTRIDCVRRLKDSDETLKLIVRHFESINVDKEQKSSDMVDSASNVQVLDTVRSSLPPPVPPRKLGKKNSFKEKQVTLTISEQNINGYNDQKSVENENEYTINGKSSVSTTISKLSRKSSFDSHILRQTKEGIACLKKGSPEEIRRLVRRLSDGKAKPPEAEVYIDLLSSEWERCLALADAESDDTGSSISTVVDKLGSMTSSVENSIPSTPILQPKTIDIQKVLNSIENIDTNIYKDIATTKFMERKNESKNSNSFLDHYVKTTKIKNQDIKCFNNNISNSEDIPATAQKLQHNDKNNNSTAVPKVKLNPPEVKDLTTNLNNKVLDHEINFDKPKPMPRILKNDRTNNDKPKLVIIPKVQCITDSLLTPTKKNCIESWLQKSEAELNNNNIGEENSTPELLPRLIDFVPKPQFKDSESESSTTKRPTTAPPPPPPTETREDGSGASLDTIGELDESNDVAENLKTTVNNETNDRKSTFEKSFWEDRTNRSDNEDKSLSNDESPLPSCPRQPPDGDEMPADAVEKVPDLPSRLPPKLPVVWQNNRKRYSYSSRTQDARSEASVKDKIAMFSNDSANSLDRLDKCGTLPQKFSLNSRKNLSSPASNFDSPVLDKRLTKSQDNLDETPYTFKRQIERPTVMGALEKESIKSSTNVTNINRSSLCDNKPLFYGSTSTLSSNTELLYNRPVYHTRSISDDNGKKNVHQSNLEYLIEQRKKSMSKLRGLVIPETQGPIPDLPEIKIQVPLSKSFLTKSNQRNISNKVSNTKPTKLDDNKWKTNLLPNNLPKYSPAFKRKSLQVYTPYSLSKESTPVCTFNEKIDTLNKVNNTLNGSKISRSSLDLRGIENKTNIQPLFPKSTLLSKPTRLLNKDVLNNSHDFKNVEIKICTTTDVVDSDNDSAMSSTQSSYRSSASSPLHNLDSIESDNSRLSPRITHYSAYSLAKAENPNKLLIGKSGEDFVKRKVCRSASTDTNVSFSSSAGSAATSGSQASCSSLESSIAENDKRKLSKSYNIDTINRRNILASAKCRSGRDDKLQSPVMETKLSHELRSRSPSPKLKTSERLSTLTSSVSAISNKGETRRRNKIFTETDSDSEDEVNVRQRKADLKNSRVKRNSSINKNKQNEINTEIPKVEDAPKDISDKIIKEIKKAGLDDFNISTAKTDAKFTTNKVKENTLINDHIRNPRYQPIVKKDEVSVTKPAVSDINVKDKSSRDNKNFVEELKTPTYTIRLKRGAGTGVGLILAGGTDCEAKDVTIHRVLAESVADKAGLKRGVKVRNINGHTMSGLTHAQSVAILKEQRSEVTIEIEKETGVTEAKHISNTKTEVPNEEKTKTQDLIGSVETVILEKAGGGTGLGFGLEGGRDSPYGDRPLTIKKLFAGGAAAQSGRVLVGAELISAGGQPMEGFTRTQAWAALKALPAGLVTLVLRNPV